MLQISKQEILAYLQEHALSFREDSSNKEDDALRICGGDCVIELLHALVD